MKKIDRWMDKIIKYSILFFPLLDIVTSIMTYNGMSVSIGIVVKALYLVLIYLYFLFGKAVDKKDKILLILFSIFMLLNIANNINSLWPNLNMEYLKLIIKFSYFIILALFFRAYLSKKDYDITILKTPIKIILISIFLAILTGTCIPSYLNIYKVGVAGWFYSANELGGLLVMLYPISLYLFFNHETSRKIDYLYVLIHALALLLLGTKVGLLGFIAISVIYILYRLIFIKKYSYKNGLLLTIVMLVVAGILWNHLPCIKNTSEKYNLVINDYIPNDPTMENEVDTEELMNEMVYSGRHTFLEDLKTTKQNVDKNLEENEIAEKNHSRKKIADDYLGYMYLTNGNLLLIERDFHDIFFFYGKIGLLFLVLILISPIIFNIKYLFKKFFDFRVDILILSLMLVVGVAFISGHTFISPMVSFYIAVVLGILNVEIKNDVKSSERKKLLISAVHMDFGGIEKTLINLLNNIDYEKYEVDLLLLLNNGPLLSGISKNVKVITPYNKIIGKIINNNNLISKIIKHALYNKYTASLYVLNKKYDVAIDYAGYYDFITYYTINTNALRKYIWVHNQPRFIINSNVTKKYKFFDKVVFVSNANKKEMQKLYPTYKKKYNVMWNLIEKPATNGDTIEWKNGLKILAVGRLCEQKRYDKLLEVASILKKDKVDFSIKILGNGPLKDELKVKAKELNVLDVVSFEGAHSNVGDYMKSADLYIMTSDFEGLPTVILEALSYGLPILGISIPPLEEIKEKIAIDKTITLVDDDLKKLAKAIKKYKKQLTKELDIEEYNKNNIKTFERLINK